MSRLVSTSDRSDKKKKKKVVLALEAANNRCVRLADCLRTGWSCWLVEGSKNLDSVWFRAILRGALSCCLARELGSFESPTPVAVLSTTRLRIARDWRSFRISTRALPVLFCPPTLCSTSSGIRSEGYECLAVALGGPLTVKACPISAIVILRRKFCAGFTSLLQL